MITAGGSNRQLSTMSATTPFPFPVEERDESVGHPWCAHIVGEIHDDWVPPEEVEMTTAAYRANGENFKVIFYKP